jgi:hypothetical protein
MLLKTGAGRVFTTYLHEERSGALGKLGAPPLPDIGLLAKPFLTTGGSHTQILADSITEIDGLVGSIATPRAGFNGRAIKSDSRGAGAQVGVDLPRRLRCSNM